MRATDGASYTGLSADSAVFGLSGGKYGVMCIGTGFGTVTLEIQGPNGSTYLTALTAFAANGYATVDLPPGQFKFAVASASAVAVSITRIPND